ncbi:hypothetical protein BD414DRAFT_480634 [Trametes punicea]|nr:hypothetical protein BD414DRAFT_480634 [Trametes punicea]
MRVCQASEWEGEGSHPLRSVCHWTCPIAEEEERRRVLSPASSAARGRGGGRSRRRRRRSDGPGRAPGEGDEGGRRRSQAEEDDVQRRAHTAADSGKRAAGRVLPECARLASGSARAIKPSPARDALQAASTTTARLAHGDARHTPALFQSSTFLSSFVPPLLSAPRPSRPPPTRLRCAYKPSSTRLGPSSADISPWRISSLTWPVLRLRSLTSCGYRHRVRDLDLYSPACSAPLLPSSHV